MIRENFTGDWCGIFGERKSVLAAVPERLCWPDGSGRLEAQPSDFNSIEFGIWSRQRRMGEPKIRKSMPACRRCAAIASPYGPAPIMQTVVRELELGMISSE